METPGLKDRMGNIGNQFAITSMLAFLISVPLFIVKEGSKWGQVRGFWWERGVV